MLKERLARYSLHSDDFTKFNLDNNNVDSKSNNDNLSERNYL